jgi:serine protease Do
MKRYAVLATVLLVLSMALTACGAGLSNLNNPAAANVAAQAAATPVPPSSTTGNAGTAVAALEGTLENIYAQVNPSVVNIQVVQSQPAQSPNSQQFPGFPGLPFGNPSSPQTQIQQAEGSGFVWDTQGDIVTNNHVVNGATKITVVFSDGTSVPGKVIGNDPDSDLAVVKVDAPANLLKPVQMGDSTQVKVGQLSVAIGSPFGEQGTMTVGFISALGRSLPANSGNAQGASYTIPDVIQTDAPINPGNSGGVLVNAEGQVIGVTTAIESSVRASSGVGFVIPAAIVQKVVPDLIKSGHYDHPWIGISGASMTPDLAGAMNLNSDQRGALVIEVLPNSPAEKAGLQGSARQATINGQQVNVGGDVITAIDGQPVKQFDDLTAYLADSTTVGQTVTLTILRQGKEMTVNLTLGARPATTPQAAQAGGGSTATAGAWLGIQGVTVNSDIAQAMNLAADQQGVLVEQVVQGSPADQAGLQGSFKPITGNGQRLTFGGDIITAVDGQAVNRMQDLQSIIGQDKPGQNVTLTILRNGKQMDVQVTLAAPPANQP